MRGPPGTVCWPSTQSPEWLGPGKGAKHTAHLGCSMESTESLSGLDMGSAQNSGPSWDSALTEHPVACAVWTWEVPSTLGCGIPRVVHPLSTTHTLAVFAVSLPLSSTTEQVSLNK